MYVRIFPFGCMKEWNHEYIENMPIRALSGWNPTIDDDDYSVFQLNGFNKSSLSNWIILRALADNFTKRNTGMKLFVLTNEFSRQLNIKPDSDTRLNCLHANMRELSYKDYLNIIDYTYQNRDNTKTLISYSASDIKELIKKLSDTEFTSLIDYYVEKHPKEKCNDIIKKITKTYFRGEEDSLPNYMFE